ncbi:MAG: RluA family pseudouridine synthase [Clostridia bacterium]|nr:RluA family pseudouridine synthase [Clostridia bacterium]
MEKFVVDKNQALYKALENEFSTISPLVLHKLVGQKNAKVNGVRVKENIELKRGDEVEIFIPQKYLKNDIKIIYQDDSIVVVNKPVKLEVVSDGDGQTLTTLLTEKVGTVFPVHRLDTNTTGLVIFARTEAVKDALIEGFKQGVIHKKYAAVVYAPTIPMCAYYQDYIVENKTTKVRVTQEKTPRGLEAILEFDVKKSNGPLHLLDITLYTGRTHQIRAQLAFHHIFVLGDGKYGDKTANKLYSARTQKLCAYELSFDFPSTSILHYLNKTTLSISIPFGV